MTLGYSVHFLYNYCNKHLICIFLNNKINRSGLDVITNKNVCCVCILCFLHKCVVIVQYVISVLYY